MSKAGDKIRELARQAQERARRLAQQADEARKRAEQKAKDLANAVSERAKADAKRAFDEAKRLADKAKSDSQHAFNQVKSANKKVKKKLKDFKGKVRKAYKKLLRKQMLAGAYILIRANASGIATRLFPSIASPSELKTRGTKMSFVPKSRSVYNQVLSKWKSLGGKESKLNEAIRKGGHLRILKPSGAPKNVTVSATTQNSQGKGGLKVTKTGFDGDVQRYALPFPNNSSYNFVQNSQNKCGQAPKQSDIFDFVYGNAFHGFDGVAELNVAKAEFYSGCCGSMSSADGGEDVSTIQLTAEEEAELDNYDVESVDETEKKGAVRRFINWIRSLFKRNNADESPYEDGSATDASFEADLANDANFASELTAEDLAFLNGIDPAYADPNDNGESGLDVKEGDENDEEDDETSQIISGVPNGLFWTGVVVATGFAIWGVVKIVQHFKNK